MRNILFFAAIALLGLVYSCKKESTPEDPKPEERIIGRWKASKAVIGTKDVLIPTATLKTELEVEFFNDKTVVFHWMNTILTSNPPGMSESMLNGVYSFDGDVITIAVTSGMDTKTVIGPIEITETSLVFTATSGDVSSFINLMEADKL